VTTDEHDDAGTDRFVLRVTAEANLAWLRTRLALENTPMPWVRTGISLIGFGFNLVEIFNRLAANTYIAQALLPGMPRYVGPALIGAGVVALVISCFQYAWISNYCGVRQFLPIAGVRERRGRTPSLVIAIALRKR
jgi:putative membrane protein